MSIEESKAIERRFAEEIRRVFPRSLLGLLIAAALGVFAATPTLAYGAENYQLGFAGTASFPSGSVGFWGWCAFGGGTGTLPTSGTTGDCNYALYVHNSSDGVTCEQRVDFTKWTIEPTTFAPFPDFFGWGSATVNPSTATICFGLFAGVFPSTFTHFDTLLPGAPGHYALNGFSAGGATFTELQIQVTAIP
jgi:hypothetical protein